ncbi:hypothetical protein BpHYR1_010526 [Brachionus plicatilis]|uniref:Uncharacterized protein n=1 Tax=Brachionus plicatilis TaxID=10195 RepID=A0A3M7PPN0_BRAPC|nr:hypothetical protein BpHYR1_010526 [Brachionus plicatilis]
MHYKNLWSKKSYSDSAVSKKNHRCYNHIVVESYNHIIDHLFNNTYSISSNINQALALITMRII